MTSKTLATLVDLDDGSSIEFELPERLTMEIGIDGEKVPQGLRNAVATFWTASDERIPLELTFVRRKSTYLDVEKPVRWLRSRARPAVLGSTVRAGPPRFGLSMPGVDEDSEWEFDPGTPLSVEGRGNVNLDEGTTYPPIMKVTFTLQRADQNATRDRT
jgi:hypothetical protein